MRGRTYRYFEGKPLYPFGHGLSYTRFTYSGLTLDRLSVHAQASLKVSLNVKNAGDRAGDEIVQLYLRPLEPRRERALQELRGFRRVHLQPGEAREVTFTLTPTRDLAVYDEAATAFVVDPGRYEVRLGASSADIRLSQHFTVEAP